ncbi:MAG: polysaccharide deacetylase family protein [Rhodospirillales bacterium]|nr:polysaccharide deacetylase family protein [Rhodospirillales bacterium]
MVNKQFSNKRFGWKILVTLIGLLIYSTSIAPAIAGQSAVVFMYHRFGESDLPTTNIRLEQFEAHIEELTSGKYTVLPLPQIISAIQEGRELPDRTIGLTIDDAYLSVYKEAWPRLKAANLPFTLFVATDAVDRRSSRYMSWDQIRELVKSGATIGGHTASHAHMVQASKKRIQDELAKSADRYQKELGFVPEIFAYPYGESSLKIAELVEQAGYKAAFGQHSGALRKNGNSFYLPRFALNEKYGDMSRFRMAANVLPIPVDEILPPDWYITGNNPPLFGFTITENVKGINQLACYASHEGQVKLEKLGDTRIEIRLTQPFPKGRSRINCTSPAGDGRWRWFSRQFFTEK